MTVGSARVDKRLPVLEEQNVARAPLIREGPSFYARLFLLLVLAAVVQATLAPYITVLGAKPDVTLIVVVAVAMLCGPMWGAVFGFAAGLLLDVALVQILGVSSFLYTLGGYFSGRYTEGIDPEYSWLPLVAAVFVVTLVVQGLDVLVMFLLGVEATASFIFFRVVLPTAVLNALLTMPVFVVCRWLIGGEQRAFSLGK